MNTPAETKSYVNQLWFMSKYFCKPKANILPLRNGFFKINKCSTTYKKNIFCVHLHKIKKINGRLLKNLTSVSRVITVLATRWLKLAYIDIYWKILGKRLQEFLKKILHLAFSPLLFPPAIYVGFSAKVCIVHQPMRWLHHSHFFILV